MIDVKDSYKKMTIRILANFQLLEFLLKLYIGKSYDMIHTCVGERVYFDFSISDVENYPLERLLNVFGKLNSNKDLQKRLNKLKTKRNHIAHQSLLITIGDLGNKDVLHEKHGEFFYLEDELSECLTSTIEEFKQLDIKYTNSKA